MLIVGFLLKVSKLYKWVLAYFPRFQRNVTKLSYSLLLITISIGNLIS
jgi:hypothetical protein